MPRKITLILLVLFAIPAVYGDTFPISSGTVPALLAPQSRFSMAADVNGTVRSLYSPAIFIEAEQFGMVLPEGGLKTSDCIAIIEKYMQGDDSGLQELLDKLMRRIERGEIDEMRKEFWIFREFFLERANHAEGYLRRSKIFSSPFQAGNRHYRLRLAISANNQIDLSVINWGNDSESKALAGDKRLMDNLDEMITAGAGDFFEYVFENEPQVAIEVLKRYPFDLENNFQPILNSIFDELKEARRLPSFHARCSIILKAEQVVVRMLDFEDAKEMAMRGHKAVGHIMQKRIERRWRFLAILMGPEPLNRIRGLIAISKFDSAFGTAGLLDVVRPAVCGEKSLIKIAYECGEDETLSMLLREKDKAVSDWKDERLAKLKLVNTTENIDKGKNALLKKHHIKIYSSTEHLLLSPRFRRAFYAALDRTAKGRIEGAGLPGFPNLRLHVKSGILLVVKNDSSLPRAVSADLSYLSWVKLRQSP